MRSRFAVAGVAAAALAVAWPAAARAKGPVASAAICGPAACVHVRGTAARTAIGRLFDQAGGISPRLAPFYRLRVRPALPQTGFYVPSQDLLVAGRVGYRLGPATAARLRAMVARLVPQRPRIVRVWVGARPASHPAAYAALLADPPVRPPAAVWSERLVPVAVELAGPTPWSAWGSAEYAPAARLLHVPDGAWVRITRGQARMVAADIGAHADRGGTGRDLRPALAALAAALATAVALVLHRRPRVRVA